MKITDTDFGQQVKIGVVGRAFTLAVAFVGSLYLAPELGPEIYGSFYLLMAAVMIADNPLTGWVTACRKRMTQEEWSWSSALGAVLLGQVIYVTVFATGVWFVRGLITRQTGNPDSWLHLLVLFTGLVLFKNSVEILKGTGVFGRTTWFNGLRDFLRVGFQLVLVMGLGFGVEGMVGGMAVASLIMVVPTLWVVGTIPAVPTRAELRDIWSYARSSIPNGFVGSTRSRVDLVILGVFWTQTSVGHYEIGNKLVLPGMFIAGVASSGMLSRVSNLSSRGEDWSHDLNRSIAYAPLFAIPIFWGVLAIGERIVTTLYGVDFAGAAPLLVGLALWMIVRTQDSLLSSTIAGLDRPDLNLKINGIALALNVALGIFLLYRFGPLGVVVATVFSQVFAFGVRWWWIPDVTPIQRPVVEQWISGVCMFVVVSLVPAETTIGVGVAIALGGLTYFGGLYAISADFRLLVRSTLPADWTGLGEEA